MTDAVGLFTWELRKWPLLILKEYEWMQNATEPTSLKINSEFTTVQKRHFPKNSDISKIRNFAS